MNIAISLNDININNIFFQDPIKNTIMNNSNFIRIIYSDELCSFNGICLAFNLPITHVDKCFTKYKCVFDIQENNMIIGMIVKMEQDIIAKYNVKNKQPVYRVCEQLKHGFIKVMNINMNNSSSSNKRFILKISGLWSNDIEYGLTYKFTQC
jgi:hypothetical protein